MSEDHNPAGLAHAESITSLRGENPRIVRLSRKAIGVASAGSLALVGGALLYAFQPPSQGDAQELFNTESVQVADGLASAPGDYSEVPKLGPPLPGDLGKPILDAQKRGAVAHLPPLGAEPTPQQAISFEEGARQRIEREREAARGSRLFFGGAAPAVGFAQAVSDVGEDARSAGPDALGLPNRPAERQTLSLERLSATPAGAILQAGSVIPAALISPSPRLSISQLPGCHRPWSPKACRRLCRP